MSKFNPGDRVFLFNAQVPAIESYDVYAVLRMPVTVKGKYQEDSLGIAGNLEAGNTEVHDQYQLVPNRIVAKTTFLIPFFIFKILLKFNFNTKKRLFQ